MVISADFAIAADQSGCACFSSANAPATCGLDIEVPAIAANSSPGTPPGSGNGDQPARICTPGPVMSGLIRSADSRFGPRDENAAMTGASTMTLSPPTIIAVAPAPALAM